MLDFIRNTNKNADILILDEPTSGIYKNNKIILLEQVKKISINKIVIMITHNEDEVKIADQIYELVDGNIIKL